ncbi:hypothetical protein INT45_013443 [Circinella minor]|uniref:DUF6729 domain-containing protein n=1 Tax=Circinella minor TaxID=1195481 RepID=A0A8H7VIC3_9FUNG|nr:hypothetical protein INT45_013443 [Circinella minor]
MIAFSNPTLGTLQDEPAGQQEQQQQLNNNTGSESSLNHEQNNNQQEEPDDTTLDALLLHTSRRYRCYKCKKTINGHDSELMDSLPYHIQSIFPAILTHRGGISRQLADWLRPWFQNAMGPERLHDLLQELHHLRYSRLQLTYLTSIDHQQQHASQFSFFGESGVNQSHPPFSNFDDPLGCAGYVSSATYLRMIYTAIMDQLRLFLDKVVIVLGVVVIKGDHTFKIIKHNMAKVGGESTFYALYTVSNEFEEIRLQQLVPTKKLAHSKTPFEQMLKSYHLYGH